jgi:hypothetical protein
LRRKYGWRFCWSLTATDVHTQWTETRAVFNRGQHAVAKRIAEIEAALPFAILSFDTDNGGEFLNWHLVNYFARRRHPMRFTRSRAYRKNDNAHVEQKNWTHVRQLVGSRKRRIYDAPATPFQRLNAYGVAGKEADRSPGKSLSYFGSIRPQRSHRDRAARCVGLPNSDAPFKAA